jgi:hypothetical protein
MDGDVQVYFSGQAISHTNIQANLTSLSAEDFSIEAGSSVLLDDGFDIEQVTLSTINDVHFYLGESHPHKGKIRFTDSRDWVELVFEDYGLWRRNSSGRETYWTWSELGFN